MRLRIAQWTCLALLTVLSSAAIPLALAQSATASPPKVAGSLQPFIDDYKLAGAVTLLASREKVLNLEAVGYADVAAKRPMKTNDLFWIASMTKPMTGVAVMMLVDEGKISVDDPVAKYLPEFESQMIGPVAGTKDPSKKPEYPVTIRHLLTHTGGLSATTLPKNATDAIGLRECVQSYGKAPLKFQPGSKYEYSNPGINTLGCIVEVVSGQPYAQFMDERLFKPLGMTNTTFWPTQEQVDRIAKSYQPKPESKTLEESRTLGSFRFPDGEQRYAFAPGGISPFPAGGLYSTAEDVARFCRMILNDGVLDGRRYLSIQSIRQMTSTQTGDLVSGGKGEAGHGFCWMTTRKLKPNSSTFAGPFGHGGAQGTEMWLDPSRNLITVYMIQIVQPAPSDLDSMKSAFKSAVNEFMNQNHSN